MINFKHEQYSSNAGYDIALIKLKDNVNFTDRITPVCLPNGRLETEGDAGIVIGWVFNKFKNKFSINFIFNRFEGC